MFSAIDIDNSGTLTIDELRLELDIINAALVLDKIKQTASQSKEITIEMMFNSVDANRSGHIDIFEF